MYTTSPWGICMTHTVFANESVQLQAAKNSREEDYILQRFLEDHWEFNERWRIPLCVDTDDFAAVFDHGDLQVLFFARFVADLCTPDTGEGMVNHTRDDAADVAIQGGNLWL